MFKPADDKVVEASLVAMLQHILKSAKEIVKHLEMSWNLFLAELNKKISTSSRTSSGRELSGLLVVAHSRWERLEDRQKARCSGLGCLRRQPFF